MVEGQHHHVSPQYLHQYASEAAWKEDHRRLDNGTLTTRALRLGLAHPKSQKTGAAIGSVPRFSNEQEPERPETDSGHASRLDATLLPKQPESGPKFSVPRLWDHRLELLADQPRCSPPHFR